MKKRITGANPYLPLWEHIPDGEPKCFTYKGETRVYIYGSHDTLRTEYCGTDYTVWSAPADDLTDWRCDGICYTAPDGEPLYAPDVVEKDGIYYMYIAEDRGSRIVVASSDNPAGPFVNPKPTELGFDPGILVDDDGHVYAYWGSCECNAAELNDDMATIKKETLIKHIIGHTVPLDFIKTPDYEHIDQEFCFFEASSLRKVNGKYVFIYSPRITEAKPELGLAKNTNSYLDYAYSDSPLGPWKRGGTISYCCGGVYEKEDGTLDRAYYHCNNHGSIVNANGQWYVFGHRKNGTDEYSRQGILEPIDTAVGKDGRVYLGQIEYDEAGEPVSCKAPEMTSQGAYVNGIDAYGVLSAGYTCYITPAENGERAYVKPVYEGYSAPLVNIKNGTVIGFKYMQFGDVSPESVTVNTKDMLPDGRIIVTADKPEGQTIAVLSGGNDTVKLISEIIGKHAVYFRFETETDKNICEFDSFTFNECKK
ncbi:MAG: family 43 glycosylhydrolase [Candidatus Ornithomonoglobus sp.]